MATGVVNELGKSTKGKPKVKVDGKWFFLGRCSSEGLMTGIRIEYEANQFGDNLWGLQTWKKIADAPAEASSGSSGSGASEDAEMRFISNVVGQAIAAKSLTDPKEIRIWAIEARKTLQYLKAAAEFDFDDEVPEEPASNRAQQAGAALQRQPDAVPRSARAETRQAEDEYRQQEPAW